MDGFLFVLLAMVAIMYLLLIRPQRQQQRRHTEMIEKLKPGDEVITAGGIYGDVTEVQPDRVSLEIAEDVEIEVAKRAIASVVPPEEEAAADAIERARADAEAEVEAGVSREDAARR
jgi:preprotein translocase subunit YajC